MERIESEESRKYRLLSEDNSTSEYHREPWNYVVSRYASKNSLEKGRRNNNLVCHIKTNLGDVIIGRGCKPKWNTSYFDVQKHTPYESIDNRTLLILAEKMFYVFGTFNQMKDKVITEGKDCKTLDEEMKIFEHPEDEFLNPLREDCNKDCLYAVNLETIEKFKRVMAEDIQKLREKLIEYEIRSAEKHGYRISREEAIGLGLTSYYTLKSKLKRDLRAKEIMDRLFRY
ncbi:MAG: hypothetical protein WC781_04650 [Candidatus Pacearchaeota archaeon]|jgi:hypothetical protein